MDQQQLRKLLEDVRTGDVPIDSAIDRMRHMPFEDLGFAKVDHHRALRCGMPEVVFGKGKTPHQIVTIAEHLLDRSGNVLVTRAEPEAAEALRARFDDAEYFPLSKCLRVWRDKTVHGKGKLAVVCAGTSDLFVAEEAFVTAEIMGNDCFQIHDIGVAGIHRLMSNRERLTEARV
ncbi:MAG: 1-(5-phosphoribosyl)-5-amino-4-imidazole-carboxylate carboxylase, partial [Bryobacteraceae bacterium]|nr:1-(5-phosphoribosyl)-5-amino-4-imidazole-carboxylate carboxylase [Bryobacteraceae bacterium]